MKFSSLTPREHDDVIADLCITVLSLRRRLDRLESMLSVEVRIENQGIPSGPAPSQLTNAGWDGITAEDTKAPPVETWEAKP